jgi:hypothetical protein
MPLVPTINVLRRLNSGEYGDKYTTLAPTALIISSTPSTLCTSQIIHYYYRSFPQFRCQFFFAQTSRSPLRSSIFQLSSSRLLSSGLLPQPLLPYFLSKMVLYRRLFFPSYFWLYASLSLVIHPLHPKIQDFLGRHS